MEYDLYGVIGVSMQQHPIAGQNPSSQDISPEIMTVLGRYPLLGPGHLAGYPREARGRRPLCFVSVGVP